MALSTAQSRSAWSPACRSKGGLYLSAHQALDACLRHYNYKPGHGTGAFNCRRITGGSGYSLHAYGPGDAFRFWNDYRLPSTALADDINPPQNPYGRRLVTNMPRPMVDAILRIRTNNGKQVWAWGGYFKKYKDAMHYEIVCSRSDLASGINRSTLPGGSATPRPAPAPPRPLGGIVYRILWFNGEPTAPGNQPDVRSAYRCLMGLAEGSGEYYPAEAYYLDGDDYKLFKSLGLREDTANHPVASASRTRFHGGPFHNVAPGS